ncbi:MAG: hypothetical protein QE264_02745 [Flavobacterium sp.]|nr:hypothetical protein [Flavobacterium sp.]
MVETAGTENKTTKEIRVVLKEVINNELLNIESLLCELQPKERLELVIKLMPFVLPKLAPEPIEKPKEDIKEFQIVVVDNSNKHLYLNKSEKSESE